MTSYCVNVAINQDEDFETHEAFVLKLTSTDPLVILDPDETKIMIMNDDSMPDC